ncbi:THAP domain-containing protein 5-like isoform X2 [Stegodyphus dumicola]|uniref:THAP domain-containing protein 5-like isoform X2 n=1 Tax=Stegodyphus dumicola TaxID=202533 RepID=UPI0015B0E08A|nr:THAP domain-containing protein 5-like isoform X2 [Stegodyphus dumicola]
MGGCAAPNCSNQSKNNFRMFRFPRNEERRRKWIVNSRRDQWIPGPGAYLCEVHFEENQYECSRQDGRKKLKPNAVPTLFNVPNPPQLLTPQHLKGIGLLKHHSVTSNFCNVKKGLLDRLKEGIVIGDGGFVFSLEKRGYVKAGPWTPEAAVEHPDAGNTVKSR